MCGIVAILRRPAEREVPSPSEISVFLNQLWEKTERLEAAKSLAELVGGVPGITALLENPDLTTEMEKQLTALYEMLDAEEADLEEGLSKGLLLEASTEIRELKDLCWSILWDRIHTARQVKELIGQTMAPSATAAMTSVVRVLDALDRLEVRGRDSAGIQILLSGGELSSPQSFVYKVAAEIGELGDNTKDLRSQIQNDDGLLSQLSKDPQIQTAVIGHTRWASVGLISWQNAHPLDSLTLSDAEISGASEVPVMVVANGDVDNYQELMQDYGLEFASGITSDSKVIPALIAAHSRYNLSESHAFSKAVSELKGSVAVVASNPKTPGQLHLSLNGSGQGMYLGFGEDCFIAASEPYGIISETQKYLRMEGNDGGQILEISSNLAGQIEGVSRTDFAGNSLPFQAEDITDTRITTRDVARGNHPHFFIKEIYEAPDSVKKTLRGKVLQKDSRLVVDIGSEALTPAVRDRIRSKKLSRIYVIGQGTAAVAAKAVAQSIQGQLLNIKNHISIESMLASELSGFVMDQDMNDALVIAVSQSGTTTDTNRTVELVKSKGAVVLSIVNRRNSDLAERSDGVFFTSDGRDVEMSVASTKAFYSQAVAGFLLACAICDLLSKSEAAKPKRQELLRALEGLANAMEELLDSRQAIAELAERLAPSRRWWAVVGSGPDRIAAEEVRIKLSELCYKSISQDSIEDKKHIDLSAEPLILVCAGGLSGGLAQDMAKEVSIYRAHKAAPIVFASRAAAELLDATDTIILPQVNEAVAFILSTMAGHLFGYEAALAIDAGAVPMRETRALIEDAVEQKAWDGEELLRHLSPLISTHARNFETKLRRGEYDGHLRVSTASRLNSLYRYATGILSLKSYQLDFGEMGTPAQVIEDLAAQLSEAIDELARPIDAIRHQAKTVTVGISRSDENLLKVKLVKEVLDAGAPRDQLSYEILKTLAGLDPVVKEVLGYTRYLIQGENLSILDRGGKSTELESRVERDPNLLGTKNQVASLQTVLITRGRRDGRIVLMVPEVKDILTVGLTLLHLDVEELLPAETAASVLRAYRGRYQILKDAVTETEFSFDESLLAETPILDLLDRPIALLADKWIQENKK